MESFYLDKDNVISSEIWKYTISFTFEAIQCLKNKSES